MFRSVRHAVHWGIVHREWGTIGAIGIDEIAWRKGHKYLTLVYQIDAGCKRLLWIGKERTEEGLKQFIRVLPESVALDRFHLMTRFSKAIDEKRAAEARQLHQDGYESVLRHSRWPLLKRPENLTQKQTVRLAELLKYNLRSVRAYLLKEDFQRFWGYVSPGWAGGFLDEWCTRTMRSSLEPMKRVARMLREHRTLIFNWFKARGAISSGFVEGFNNKAKLATKTAYGYWTYNAIETALYHQLGNLPEPKLTHKFW